MPQSKTENKPDWKDAPEWANYLTKDADGDWWWHEYTPELGSAMWHSLGQAVPAISHIDWRSSMEQKPQHKADA